MIYPSNAIVAVFRDALRQIGYPDDLLRDDYEFADFLSPGYDVHSIEFAAFAQHPPSFRNACFGVTRVPQLNDPEAHRVVSSFRALGAPQVFTIEETGRTIGRWKVTGSGNPVLLEEIASSALHQTILARKADWRPEEVLRAKATGLTGKVPQFDFFDIGLLPVLEREVHLKLDELLGRTVGSAKEEFRRLHGRMPGEGEFRKLFRLVFRFIAAKLLADRGHMDRNWLDPDPRAVIREVDSFYFGDEPPEEVLEDAEVQRVVWDSIRSGLRLQNLSVEALAYVYETTFVSDNVRRAYDTHATPYEVAEYIVRQLPIESLARDERTVFEPFAGHAPFLTAALGRLRALLPPETTFQERHRYLVRMLRGMELDSFAREIARYSLILADYPNSNSWQVLQGDVFASPDFQPQLEDANIVLSNPPYGNFGKQERKKYSGLTSVNKAAEGVLRILRSRPKMVGLLVPRSFLFRSTYREARQLLASSYGEISITVLPDIAFRFSQVDTVAITASGSPQTRPRVARVFVSGDDYPTFLGTGRATWKDSQEIEVVPSEEPLLWEHPLERRLKAHLAAVEGLRPLRELAKVRRGVEYVKPIRYHVSSAPETGYRPGLQNVKDGFEPYFVRAAKYLDMNPAHLKTKAHAAQSWNQPKVIANAARNSRRSWRIMAAVDDTGLICSQRFHLIWPRDGIAPEVIAAVLNGPVANALLSLPEGRDNLIDYVKALPVPEFGTAAATLRALVDEYRRTRAVWLTEQPMTRGPMQRCRELMAEIDRIVLEAYALPAELRDDLEAYMALGPRPGPAPMRIMDVRNRLGWLVDKKHGDEITPDEAGEIRRLESILDDEEEAFYRPFTEKLSAIYARLAQTDKGGE